MKPIIAIVLSGTALAGCAGKEEYAPEPGASGEQIFQTACAECHQPKEQGNYFELTKDKATAEALAEKITKGGLFMPAFPNITGNSLKAVSDYVLSNSKLK